MATPTIREVVSTAASGANATVTTGAGTAVNDVLVCFAGDDFYTAAEYGPPTPGTWVLEVTGDRGSNAPHMKIYTRTVTSGGAQTVTVPRSSHGDEEVYNTTFVLTGADTTTPNDNAAGSSGAASTSHVAPSVSPTTSDALLLCGVQSDGSGAGSYTPPSGMTERSDITDGGFANSSTASLVLAASGATGTKTFTATVSASYASASIAIKGPGGGGGPTAIPGRPQFYAPRRRAANW